MITSFNYKPPIKSRKTMALNKGTVKLSKPFGVSASQTVATVAAPKEASAKLKIEIG